MGQPLVLAHFCTGPILLFSLPVGERESETKKTVSNQSRSHTYDAANRLTSVDGQAYTWDANGNLLNDGSKSYTYDQANRLTNISANGLAWSAVYNGDGARLRQMTNGVPTTYTLDPSTPLRAGLNAGLVQVLTMQEAGGTTTYLYGVTRIGEQQSGGWAYYLSDALGSVRQLVDSSAQVTLARGYMPYGEELWSLGEGVSAYGYTGEDWNVTTQLVFLRARYMQPGLGMFLSRDPWSGDELRPGSMNGWNYVQGNPINYTDPTGMWRWWATPFIYHTIVENYYEGTWGFFNPLKQLEYPIPGTPFHRPDMFNSALGDVYEIEPWFNQANGVQQVIRYVGELQFAAAEPLRLLQGTYWLNGAPYNWNNTPFHAGTGVDWPGKLRTIIPPFFMVDLVADYVGNGMVIYWLEPNALALVPFAVPNKRLVKPRNWVPGRALPQPTYVLSWDEACGYALIMVGGTILVFNVFQDIATGGLGVPDDAVVVPAGIFLIYLGSRQAGFVPVQESGQPD